MTDQDPAEHDQEIRQALDAAIAALNAEYLETARRMRRQVEESPGRVRQTAESLWQIAEARNRLKKLRQDAGSAGGMTL